MEQRYLLDNVTSLNDYYLHYRRILSIIEGGGTSCRICIGSSVPKSVALRIFLSRIEKFCRERGIILEVLWEDSHDDSVKKPPWAITDGYQHELREGRVGKEETNVLKKIISLLDAIGKSAVATKERTSDFISFTGQLISSIGAVITSPKRLRIGEWMYQLEHVGARAMPIVGIMSFLIGLVTAFQAAVQLRQFGANIFVADLVALAMARELSPLITAILMVGRTTSAFTAELGTMKVNEELDALKVLNISLFDYLVIPRVLSAAFSGPLLTAWSFATGLIGGMTVAYMGLDVTFSSFMQEVYGILTISDLWVGFFKSILFALIVGIVGCFMGLETGFGADSVGQQTTKAVIQALFLMIITDAIVTVLAHVFKW